MTKPQVTRRRGLLLAALLALGLSSPLAHAQHTTTRAISGSTNVAVYVQWLGSGGYTVVEQLPSPLTPQNINESGTWDSGARTITWNCSCGGGLCTKTLQYTVTGACTSGTYVVTGYLAGMGPTTGDSNLVITVQPAYATVDTSTSGITVYRTVKPRGQVTSWTYEENLPANFYPDLSWGGSYNHSAHQITWGPYSGTTTQLCRYAVHSIYGGDCGFNGTVRLTDSCGSPVNVPSGYYTVYGVLGVPAPARSVSGFRVTISQTVFSELVSSWYYTETLPAGLEPREIEDGGAWNAGARTITWGPFADETARFFHYSVDGFSGQYALSGAGTYTSYYGASKSATGDSAITITYGPPPMWVGTGVAGSVYSYCLSRAGDVNGDGLSDILIGSYMFSNTLAGEGRAYLYQGLTGGCSVSANWTFDGAQADANLGLAVGPAGDVNGDGYDDIVVGAPFYDAGELTDAGRALVFCGSATGLSPSASWTVDGTQAGESVGGYQVATVGDVNKDGYDDVGIGAYMWDNGAITNAGKAFVYMGSATGLCGAAAWSVQGDQAETYCGVSLGAAGDVNGDGCADAVVGTPFYQNALSRQGRVQVFYGSTSGLSPSASWTAYGPEANGGFGIYCGGAGDVNGDGFDDVIATAYLSGESTNEGKVYLFYGSSNGLSSSAVWTGRAWQAASLLGNYATAADVNNDGYGDIIVGAPQFDGVETNDGRVFIWYGSPSGPGPNAAWMASGNHPSSGQGLGWCVSAVGDVNADGCQEFLAAFPGWERAYLYRGWSVTHYVSSNGLSIAPYGSWKAAASNIQEAIAAGAAEDTVLVSNGLYNTGYTIPYGTTKTRVAITNAVAVRSVNGPLVTAIEGEGTLGESAVRGVYMTPGSSLSGFTITKGATANSYNQSIPFDVNGGGIMAQTVNSAVSNCVIASNAGYWYGGGVFGGTLYNCLVISNTCDAGGGLYGGWAYNCKLLQNAAFGTATKAGGEGGGAMASVLFSCDVLLNFSVDVGGGLADCPDTYNCIVWGNTSSSSYTNHYGCGLNYCCSAPLPVGQGNTDQNPSFQNAAGRDFRLAPGSPCINAGYNQLWMTNALDFEGNPRIIDAAVDIGAYEAPYTAVVRLFLQGPYAGSHRMSSALSDAGLLPLQSPYAADPRLALQIPTNVTDWVLLETRYTPEGKPIRSRSAFLRNDGYLLASDGGLGIPMGSSTGIWYVAVRHRNHLGVMSADPLVFTNITTSWDFCPTPGQYYGGTNAALQLEPNAWGLIAGDADGDGKITATDQAICAAQTNQTGYKAGDFNLDGVVNE